MNESKRCEICNEWSYDWVDDITGTICGDCAGFSVDDEGFGDDGMFYDEM